jgi:hypothetical protein
LKSPSRIAITIFTAIVTSLPIGLAQQPGSQGQQNRGQLTPSPERAASVRQASFSGAVNDRWYFAVSGDSRDCGDLIMPKIARAIADNRQQAPVEFYWHLGDFRALYRIDCDMAKRTLGPAFNCLPAERQANEITAQQKAEYQAQAWDDFIRRQVQPFDQTQVFLGIGNHEVIGRERKDFLAKFQKWLAQPEIVNQREADAALGIPSHEGATYYHFVKRGVDFIYLDNADKYNEQTKQIEGRQFDAPQVVWLSHLLAADVKDDSIKTIIVGMHAALPYSTSRNHAMDATCQGICSGKQVYDLLYQAQNLDGQGGKRKYVYVLASHSHYLREDIFNTPEHRGQVLPGWIIGTAGAEQYDDQIKYGYLQAEVHPDGTVSMQFKGVTESMPPLASGPEASRLTEFCFKYNKRVGKSDDAFKGDCSCGAAK